MNCAQLAVPRLQSGAVGTSEGVAETVVAEFAVADIGVADTAVAEIAVAEIAVAA